MTILQPATGPIWKQPRPPKVKKFLKREGAVGRATRKSNRDDLDAYFKRYGAVAPCQLCGGILAREDADPCHKVPRWKHRDNSPRNKVAGHRACHDWQEHSDDRLLATEVMIASPASLENGLKIAWPRELYHSLMAWKKKWKEGAYGKRGIEN